MQEAIGLERNHEWLGRDVEVLVEQVTPTRRRLDPNDADADDADLSVSPVPVLAGSAGEGSVALAGRTRHNKLVHLAGHPDLVGQQVRIHVEYAGPFALRGHLVEAQNEPDVFA